MQSSIRVLAIVAVLSLAPLIVLFVLLTTGAPSVGDEASANSTASTPNQCDAVGQDSVRAIQ